MLVGYRDERWLVYWVVGSFLVSDSLNRLCLFIVTIITMRKTIRTDIDDQNQNDDDNDYHGSSFTITSI